VTGGELSGALCKEAILDRFQKAVVFALVSMPDGIRVVRTGELLISIGTGLLAPSPSKKAAATLAAMATGIRNRLS
jgi:hypothetical protein